MQRTHVSSGTIVSVGYEAATSTLELEMVTQEVFQFFNVPLRVYIELMNAGYKGDYYSHNIIPAYECKKVSEDYV